METMAAPSAAAAVQEEPSSESEESESDEEGSDWSSSETSSASDGEKSDDGLSKWKKKDTSKSSSKSSKPKKEKDRTKPRAAKVQKDDSKLPLQMARLMDLRVEDVEKKLQEINLARGKKNTDRNEQLGILRRLFELSVAHPQRKVNVLMSLISVQFDFNLSMHSSLAVDIWKSATKDIDVLLDILFAHREIVVQESVVDEESTEDGSQKLIRGSLIAFIERLDDEFTKSLQNIDPHTTDYIERLKDETDLCRVIFRSQLYFEATQNELSSFRAIIRRVEHMYFKHGDVIARTEALIRPPILAAAGLSDREPIDPSILMDYLCGLLYKVSDDRIRTRAMLCHVYHHALHDRFYKARDLLLMSHLQDTIQHADVPTQVLYNRALVQIGLCAFRNGMIKDTHASLHEISSSGKVKELLAQGLSQRYSDRTVDQERMIEKQRQIPFHMHINLELLECVFLTASMLLEVPSMASASQEMRPRVISKPFRRMLDYTERQVFTGPPENTRDHIMAASRALSSGDWRTSRDLVLGVKIWNLMPNVARIKEMLCRKLQEEGLRTYLLAYCTFYESLSLAQLADMFELSKEAVHGIVSKMVINEELHAFLDQPSEVILLHKVEPSRLQTLSLQLSEKACGLVEQNEKMLELKSGFASLKNEPQKQTRGQGTCARYGSIADCASNFIFKDKEHTHHHAPHNLSSHAMNVDSPPRTAAIS